MERKKVSGIMTLLLLVGMFSMAFNIPSVKAEPATIYADDTTTQSSSGSSTLPIAEWNKTYGTLYWEDAYAGGIQTSDGGYAMAGTFQISDGFAKYLLIKTDNWGNQEWSKTYGHARRVPYPRIYEACYAFSLIETSDDGYALAGVKIPYGHGPGDFWLVRTDALGNEQWNKTYGETRDEWAFSVVQTSDGGYALAGYYEEPSFPFDYYFWLVKTDAYGNAEWNKTYGRGMAFSLVQTSDGGYAVVGRGGFVKTDGYGNVEWSKNYSGRSLVQTEDGGFAIIDYDRFTKTDEYGNMQLSKTYGGTDIIQTRDGGYAITGYSALVKIDEYGSIQWSMEYNEDSAWDTSVVQTFDGGYAIVGTSDPSYDPYYRTDFWLIKLATPIPASVEFHPETLNLQRVGQWVTAYIELPEGYNVADINVSSIHLNNIISVDPSAPSQIGDYDCDGIPDIMVKFSTSSVASNIFQHILFDEKFAIATLDMIGKLNDGTFIRGSDTIKVTMRISQG